VNALVGALVGLERSVLPLVGERDFGLASKSAILSFIVAFGVAKALANLAAGSLAERAGRRRLLAAGWLLAAPVPPLLALAPDWSVIVLANFFLGASQGVAWSMTVLMKIDLVGPERRGLALGVNESAGYLGVAATALATGALAGTFAPRTVIWAGAAVLVAAGLGTSLAFVRDTGAHVAREQEDHVRGPPRRAVLVACSQAGFANNLNDALTWGLVPLYLAANGAGATRIGAVAAVYPAVWGAGQLGTGWLSDHTGRRPLIVAGMFVQAGALALLVAGGGEFATALAAASILGAGTALVYPTLIAAVSDVVSPRERARAIGRYRFWRDSGFVAGALLAGFGADAFGSAGAIGLVAALTALSGVWFAATRSPATVDDLLAASRRRIRRLTPQEALAARDRGALLVDVRSSDDRARDGVVPGSIHVPRTVLEWRLDTSSGYTNPAVRGRDEEVVVFCDAGFSSSLAAAELRRLGFRRVGDIEGGFRGWRDAGLPVGEARREQEGVLPGMGAPEPLEDIAAGDTRHRQPGLER
jgi:MFS family permease